MKLEEMSVGMPASTPSEETAAEKTRPSRDGRMLLTALIDEYMAQYAGKDSTRAHRLQFWVGRLGHVPIGELIDDDVADAIDALAVRPGRHFMGPDADGNPIFKAKAGKISGSTLNRYHAALQAVCTFGQKKRLVPRDWVNPAKFVEKRPENPAKERYLSQPEIERLLAACKAQKWRKLHTQVLMALCTGCRRGELRGMRWADVDLELGQAKLGTSKNGDPRLIPLLPAVVADLRVVKGDAKPADLLFASTRRPGQAFNEVPQWMVALKTAGIRGMTFHGLRHTAASVLVMSGASLHEVGKVLGHRSPKMTMRYSHLSVAHTTDVMTKGLGHIGMQGKR